MIVATERLDQVSDHASRITDSQTVGRDVLGDYATGADRAVATNTNAGQDDYMRTYPNMILDHDRLRWRDHLMPHNVMLVVVHDQSVVA